MYTHRVHLVFFLYATSKYVIRAKHRDVTARNRRGRQGHLDRSRILGPVFASVFAHENSRGCRKPSIAKPCLTQSVSISWPFRHRLCCFSPPLFCNPVEVVVRSAEVVAAFQRRRVLPFGFPQQFELEEVNTNHQKEMQDILSDAANKIKRFKEQLASKQGQLNTEAQVLGR